MSRQKITVYHIDQERKASLEPQSYESHFECNAWWHHLFSRYFQSA